MLLTAMPHLTTRNLKKTWLWIKLANSPYAWLHQTSKFHHQTSLLSKILCIFFFALFILCMDILFNSKRHGNSFMQNSVALHYFKMRLSGAICLLTSGVGGGGLGLLGYFLGGYVPPGTPNWHPVLKKFPPKLIRRSRNGPIFYAPF